MEIGKMIKLQAQEKKYGWTKGNIMGNLKMDKYMDQER